MAATDLERLVVQLSADIKKYENAINRANGVTNKQFSAIERRAAQMNTKLSAIGQSAAHSLIEPLTGLGAALSVREIAEYADAWTQAGNMLRSAATSAGVQTRSLNQLKEDANGARTSLESYVDLYAKLIRSASAVAKSEDEISLATTIVSKAFKAGGASAQEQAAGILQLSQALGSGVLQGDELRSLRENAPVIAKAIADEFGTTIAGLKQLGAEGKLTSDRVFRAIINAQKPVEAQFKATNATIRDALTQVNNEFTAYIGNADESAGASRKLVEALQFVADNFKEIADVVAEFATVIIAALTGRAIVGLIAGLGNAVVALGTFLTAVRAGTLAVGTLTAALGPIGLIAGGAAAAIYLLNDRMSATEQATQTANEAIAANASALDIAKSSSGGYTKALRNQIAMQAEAAKASFNLAYAELNAARARANNFRAVTKSLTGVEVSFDPLDVAAHAADDRATAIGKAALALKAQVAEIDAAMKNVDDGFGGGVKPGGGSGKKPKLDGFEREVQQIKERTAALTAETAAQAGVNPLINDYGYAVEFAHAKQELLNEAQQAGVKVTPALTASIDQLAAGYANAVVASEQLSEKQDEIRQRAEDAMATAKDVTRGIIDGFVEGASAADILTDSLKKIGDALLDDVLSSIFKVNSAAGGGGFLSSIFGSLFGGGQAAIAASGGVGLYDKGGYTGNGGKYEPAGIVHKGEYVLDAETTKRIGVNNLRKLQGYAEGGLVGAPRMPSITPRSTSASPSITYAPVIDARGADSAAVARLEQVMAKQQAEFSAKVIDTVKNGQRRRIL